MAEQTTNYIEIDGEGKYIEDTAAREGVNQNAADIETINAKIPASASASNKLLAKSEIIYEEWPISEEIPAGGAKEYLLDITKQPPSTEYATMIMGGIISGVIYFDTKVEPVTKALIRAVVRNTNTNQALTFNGKVSMIYIPH